QGLVQARGIIRGHRGRREAGGGERDRLFVSQLRHDVVRNTRGFERPRRKPMSRSRFLEFSRHGRRLIPLRATLRFCRATRKGRLRLEIPRFVKTENAPEWRQIGDPPRQPRVSMVAATKIGLGSEALESSSLTRVQANQTSQSA